MNILKRIKIQWCKFWGKPYTVEGGTNRDKGTWNKIKDAIKNFWNYWAM